ncbi:hypothetical protein RI367_006903 [Sorochytrium milnesiophthora]
MPDLAATVLPIARRATASPPPTAQLPVFAYNELSPPPMVSYSKCPQVTATLISDLRSEDDVYGFDLEWPVTYRIGGSQEPVALMQIASRKHILLLHVAHMPQLPSALVDFLTDASKRKVGLNIQNDAQKLKKDRNVAISGLIELWDYARVAERPLNGRSSLQRLVAHFLQADLPKPEERVSNWAAETLTPKQLHYAANDAYVSLELWDCLKQYQNQLEESRKPRSPSPSSFRPLLPVTADTMRLAPRHRVIFELLSTLLSLHGSGLLTTAVTSLWQQAGEDLTKTWELYGKVSSAQLTTVLSYILEGAVGGLPYKKQSLYRAVQGYEHIYQKRFSATGLLDL